MVGDIEDRCNMYTQQLNIYLASTDSAGVLFFAEQFRLAHQVYESFLREKGCPLHGLLNSECAFPIVHSSADFLAPIYCGDQVDVHLSVAHIGTHSFTLEYLFCRSQTLGTVKTVHVCIDKETREKKNIPLTLKNILKD